MTGFRFLYPPECDPAQEVRMKSFDFIQALQIDDMVVLQNDRYRGYSDLTLEKFFSTDPNVLQYRMFYKIFHNRLPILQHIRIR